MVSPLDLFKRNNRVDKDERNRRYAICKECQAGDYDTIVIGKHGHSKIHEFLIGSVAEKVVRHTNGCVVWVVE